MRDTEQHEEAMAPDPQLGAALRLALGDPPVEAVDWGRLEWRILAAARARRRPPGWWDVTAGWARGAVAAGLVAGLVAVVTLAVLRSDGSTTAGTGSDLASARTALFHAATGSAADAELVDAMTAPTRSEWLFSAAVSGPAAGEPSQP